MSDKNIFLFIIIIFYLIPGTLVLILGIIDIVRSFFNDLEKDNNLLLDISDYLRIFLSSIIPILNIVTLSVILNKLKIFQRLCDKIECVLDYQPHISKIIKRKS